LKGHIAGRLLQRWAGWWVHIFTASGAFVGLLAVVAIHELNFLRAFWLMGGAILIDAIDGFFARQLSVRERVPEIDGALLDNIVDFFTYTLVPCFMLLVSQILPAWVRLPAVLAVTLSSAYQFTHVEAKTRDHFFRGFPSYWNIVVFYLYFWQMSAWINTGIVFVLAILSFVPIKYIYPSRLDYLTHSRLLRMGMLAATVAWGLATAGLLWMFPESNHILVLISTGYPVMYVLLSLYRTKLPLFHFN